MGALLVLTGIAFLTGSVNQMSVWLLETFPVLGKIRLAKKKARQPAGFCIHVARLLTSPCCNRSPDTRRK